MRELTFEEEQNHKFDKHEAQVLIGELCAFIVLLKVYSTRYRIVEGFDVVLWVVKYIEKVAGRLYFELEAHEAIE